MRIHAQTRPSVYRKMKPDRRAYRYWPTTPGAPLGRELVQLVIRVCRLARGQQLDERERMTILPVDDGRDSTLLASVRTHFGF